MEKYTLVAFLCLLASVGGYASPLTRVVGGVDAADGQFPHQVSLRRSGSHTCGGSIITKNYVLTAAHCVGSDPKPFSIRAGSNDRLSGGVVVNVAEIKIHENYGDFLNDVALLKLEKPLIFSKNIQPIRLASRETPPGEKVTISGWGRLKHGGDIPQKLQYNDLFAISRSQCKEQINFDSDALLCLAHESNNGACNGDSGGPAHYNNEVVGIAGFVFSSCGTQFPDGYAKVFYHVNWIKKHSDYV